MASTLYRLLLILCYQVSFVFSINILGNETDWQALMAFKQGIASDPHRVLASWNASHHFCKWQGVTCSRRRLRVAGLYLPPSKLVGRISPHLANLSFLRQLDLGDNGFQGELPQELGRLFRLRSLDLSDNFMEGRIPASISNCSSLREIIFTYNKLIGEVPPALGSLQKLEVLALGGNHLSGTIPSLLGNLSSLLFLSIAGNELHGWIPDDLGRLSQLQGLQLSLNSLTGTIPASIFNNSGIYLLDVTNNSLHGSLPQDIGIAFPNLQYLTLALNQFSGSIPATLSNASSLQWLDLYNNKFTGPIPHSLFRNLLKLSILNLGDNELGFVNEDGFLFINSLTNCSFLEVLSVQKNHLNGLLPESISKLSTKLQSLLLGENNMFGTIPRGIGNLTQLRKLNMEKSLLMGTLPHGVGNLKNLEGLYLAENYLSGHVPSFLGNLTFLSEIDLSNNRFLGPLPQDLGNRSRLEQLDLSNNDINGSIPKPLMRLGSLFIFILANNSLTGPLPLEIGQLKGLTRLMISGNELSGSIPYTLGLCESLLYLYMDGNFFEGPIPASLNTLKGIKEMDLSRNNLSGLIPGYFRNLSELYHLNLSYNHFEGEVPTGGVFDNASAVSILGNDRLCGDNPKLQLSRCHVKDKSSNGRSLAIKVAVSISVVALVVSMACLFAMYWKGAPCPSSQVEEVEPYHKISYVELHRATNGFSSANVIGHGSFGVVYKGILDQYQTAVAIKVIDVHRERALKSFMAECNALRNIRHRNLVKILTACSSMDSNGIDFKALVFEYMPNGSLDEWLHKQDGQGELLERLGIVERLNVAIDVASAVDYLHNYCDPPVVHCDLKPSNVLLDNDLVAHVSDFGLAKMLATTSNYGASTSVLKGTIGYIPPGTTSLPLRFH